MTINKDAIEAEDLDMTWVDIAVCRNATVIADYSPGFSGFIDEFHFEDVFEEDPPIGLAPGMYRWSGFTVGSWDEGELISLHGGQFSALASLTPDRTAIERAREALEEMRSRRQRVIDSYESVGPQWTSELGSEMYDASYVVDSAKEDVALCLAALRTPAASGDDLSALCALSPVWVLPRTKTDMPKKPGKEAYEYVDCLVLYKGDVLCRPWNCEHEVFDDEAHDDHFCEWNEVTAYADLTSSIAAIALAALPASGDEI